MRASFRFLLHALFGLCCASLAQATEQVVDITTRPGVTQRFLFMPAADAQAAVILFAGGHGGLQMDASGAMQWGSGNFLVRSAPLFAGRKLDVIVLDAPSDRQSPPHLSGFRQSAEHADDVKAVIAWVRARAAQRPVWLVGTSRGTQSAAAVATRLTGADGPDGIVLTATILSDARSRPVSAMPLETLKIPVLVVHHEADGCRNTLYRDVPALMEKLTAAPRKALIAVRGGANEGNPCAGRAHHGFNGLEQGVVDRIAAWMTAR